MYKYILMTILITFSNTLLAAEKEERLFELSHDVFLVGSNSDQIKDGVDDLFMFGETISSQRDITGSLHMFGRKVNANGAVGRDAYLAGMYVTQEGKVTGDLTVSGYDVQVGEVGGDLRAAGSLLTVSGNVLGYALVSGKKVEFNGSIKGDLSLKSQEVNFSDNARVEGKLFIYEQQHGDIKIPPQVANEDQIVRRHVSIWSEEVDDVELWNWWNFFSDFMVGVMVVSGVAALTAMLSPKKLAVLRRSILEQPFRSLTLGFIALSIALGSSIVLLITGIGIYLTPIPLTVAFIGVFGGYVVGSYALGVGILLLAKQAEPSRFEVRALAAVIGAFAAALIALIPVIGWLLFLAIMFAGLGSIVKLLFRPKMFSNN